MVPAAGRRGQGPKAEPVRRPLGRPGAAAAALLVFAVFAGLAWSALTAPTARAVRPVVFTGQMVLADTRPLTVIDLATAQVTVRLDGVDADVGAPNYADVQPVPVPGGTVLVNTVDGAFNFLGEDDYVDDGGGAGVSLGPLPGSAGAEGIAAGPDAYILRAAPRSTVSLVGAQTVLAAARSRPGGAPPPVSVTLPGQVDLGSGGAVATGGDLYLLYGRAGGCDLTRVSDTGGALSAGRPTALRLPCSRSTLEAAGPPGREGAALAEPGRVLLLGDGPDRVVPTPFDADARAIVAVTGARSGYWFLAGGRTGWEVFGLAPAAGGRTVTTGPFALSRFTAGSSPAPPVLAGGFLYTLDRARGPDPSLWTIDVDNGHMAPVPGAARYPLASSREKDGFLTAQVLLDGPRIVFNNPGSLDAVVVFTDGSRPPVDVDKSRAVDVSATGPTDLEATPGAAAPSRPTVSRPAAPPPVPIVAQVSQRVACALSAEKPYAPQIATLTPGSGSVLVTWSYQLLDQNDCEPDSWIVQVTDLSGPRQPEPAARQLTGEDRYLFTGLLPATAYEVVVTALINDQSTPSAPAFFSTPPRGPDAPLDVSTRADGHGDWIVSWEPCTESADPACVVPAAEWSVTGAACDGFVGTPPTIHVAGAQTTVTIDADQLGLLGDSLSFSVQGSLASGLEGDPTSDDECTQAWEAPTAAEVEVASSGTANPDGTVTATVDATTSGALGQVEETHPSAIELVFGLGGRTVGPTTSTSAVFEGLPAGETFTPQVTVYPTGHPTASVTVDGPAFVQTVPWPRDTAGATAAGTVDPDDPNTGRVTVTLPADTPHPVTAVGPGPAPAAGSGPIVQCGSTTSSAPPQTVSSGDSFSVPMPDLVHQGGQCSIQFSLEDTAVPDPYGTDSPEVDAGFTIGSPPHYSFQQGFAPQCTDEAQGGNECGPGGQPWQIVVATSGSSEPDQGGGNWTVTTEVRDPGRGTEEEPDLCATSTSVPSGGFPFTIDLPATCPYDEMSDIDVTVSFEYLGQIDTVDAGYPDNHPGSPVPPPVSTTTTTTTDGGDGD